MGPESLKRKVKPNGHFIKNRGTEIVVGLVIFVIGGMLLWDAFDGRGKSMPWPASSVLPW